MLIGLAPATKCNPAHLAVLPILLALLHHQLVGGVGGDADPLLRRAAST